MPFRLHRSILFWLGLLVLAFLGWAWWQSVVSPHYVRVGRFHVTNAAHRLHFTITDRSALWDLGKPTIAGDTWKTDYFPRPSVMLKGLGDPITLVKIPHWLAISCTAALWFLLLIASWLWHRLRQREPRERGASGLQNGP